MHWALGGEATIIPWKEGSKHVGLVFNNASRGVITQAMNVFREIKMGEDRLRATNPELYNAARREGSKLGMVAAGGKFLQKIISSDMYIMNDAQDISKYIEMCKLEGNNVVVQALSTEELEQHPSLDKNEYFQTRLDGIDLPKLVKVDTSQNAIIENHNEKLKSVAFGIFIYSWSHVQMVVSLLTNAVKSGAAFATETDSLHFDKYKYEAYMEKEFPGVNPYDTGITAFQLKLREMCKLFNMSDTSACPEILSNEDIGTMRCQKAAAEYAYRKNISYTPKRESDFGDFTTETGITVKTIDGKKVYEEFPVECCYVGKKEYYVSKTDDGEKMKCKGVGKNSKNAQTLWKYRENKKSLLERYAAAPNAMNKEFYEKLGSGEACCVADQRFVGNLQLLDKVHSFLVGTAQSKLIVPDDRTVLQIRTEMNSEYQMTYPNENPNKDGTTMYLSVNGEYLLKDELLLLIGELQKAYGYSLDLLNAKNKKQITSKGATISLGTKKIFITPKNLRFLGKRYIDLLKTKIQILSN